MIRQIFQKVEPYPVDAAFVALGTGICASYIAAPSMAAYSQVALILSLGIVLIAVRIGGKRVLWTATTLLFFLLGVHLGFGEQIAGTGSYVTPEKRLISATVHRQPESGPKRRVLLLKSGTNEDDRRVLPGIGRMSLRDCAVEPGRGDRIVFRARIRRPRNRGNPGGFNWENHCANNGIRWQVSVSGPGAVLLVSRGSPYHPSAVLYRARERIREFLEAHSQGDVRAILKGVVLGDRGELGHSLRQSFINSGLIHMLSASGLHVGFVVLLTLIAVRVFTWFWPEIFLRVPLKKIGGAASAITMIMYCLLVGARVPTIRATMMGLVIVAAVLSDRPWRPLNSLAVAGLLILLVYPLSVFSPGFQLSFAAVAGILVAVPKLMERLDKKMADRSLYERNGQGRLVSHLLLRLSVKPIRFFAALFFTSLAAQIAVAPILFKTFHSFPLYSLFANMVASPIFLLALPTAIVASVIGTAFPAIGGVVLWPAEFLIQWIINVSEFFAGLKYSNMRISHMGALEFILVAILAAMMIFFLGKPSKKKLLALSIAAICLVGFILVPNLIGTDDEHLKVVYLNVGSGDAAYVKPRAAKGLLIDAGPRNYYFDSGQSIVLPFLQYSGVSSLSGIIISHPQMDHMGGVLSVMERIHPGRIWWNPIPTHSRALREILAAAASRRIPNLHADRTVKPMNLGNARLFFLNSRHGTVLKNNSSRDLNNSSVVLRLEFRDVSFLFTGDLEREGEDELLSSGENLRADVLKVGHHGSNTSTSLRFLKAVQPKIAVISAGWPSRSGCPDFKILERLNAAGVKTFWTGRDGAVTVTTDGASLRVQTGRGETWIGSDRKTLEAAAAPHQ